MKHAGYDGIVILGKAEKPVCLSIHDEDVEIRDANGLWGVETFEAQRVLTTDEPEASILVIGPAGENLSRIAVILNETKFAAGQGGFGGVMGSKNLKAIVVRGTGGVGVAKPDMVLELAKRVTEENKKMHWLRLMFRTPYTAPQETKDVFAQRYFKKHYGCYGCPLQCHSIQDVPGIGLSGVSCANWLWAPKLVLMPKRSGKQMCSARSLA
jgi:aldehyde:ferredoxin oxidoreductase